MRQVQRKHCVGIFFLCLIYIRIVDKSRDPELGKPATKNRPLRHSLVNASISEYSTKGKYNPAGPHGSTSNLTKYAINRFYGSD